MRLLQVSDPHFGTEQAPVADALAQLAHELAPDVLVLSGDITQRGRSAQFASARAYVETLGVSSRVAVPGNHDIPLFNPLLRVFRPYANYRRAFGPELEPSLAREDLILLTVNTTRAHRHKHGVVSATQIARVSRELERATAAQLRIVVVHQPMHVPRVRDEENLLRNADAAAHAWSAAGADLVLGGHIHLPYVLPMSERYAGLPRELWCVQAGTALSSRVRWEAPNSVNVIDYPTASHGSACVVTRYDYAVVGDATAENLTDTHRFRPQIEHCIALQR